MVKIEYKDDSFAAAEGQLYAQQRAMTQDAASALMGFSHRKKKLVVRDSNNTVYRSKAYCVTAIFSFTRCTVKSCLLFFEAR